MWKATRSHREHSIRSHKRKQRQQGLKALHHHTTSIFVMRPHRTPPIISLLWRAWRVPW